MNKEKKCECCNNGDVQWELKHHTGEIYNVCSNCLHKLTSLSLSKTQFNNLLKNGHTTDEFLLNDDYYDIDGDKLQSIINGSKFQSI